MDFTKDTERLNYRSGYFIGFLFSYLLFFSILFFILFRFKIVQAINIKYGNYLVVLVIIYLGYRLIEGLFRTVSRKSARRVAR
jgi:hypothetical protein